MYCLLWLVFGLIGVQLVAHVDKVTTIRKSDVVFLTVCGPLTIIAVAAVYIDQTIGNECVFNCKDKS